MSLMSSWVLKKLDAQVKLLKAEVLKEVNKSIITKLFDKLYALVMARGY